MEIKDRIPTLPGRRRLVDEETGKAYYVTIERADEPLPGNEGTAINAKLFDELLTGRAIGHAVELPEFTSLNNIVKPGVYCFKHTNNIIGIPHDGGAPLPDFATNPFSLLVLEHASMHSPALAGVTQVFIRDASTLMYIRNYCHDRTPQWTPWHEVYTGGRAVPISGGGTGATSVVTARGNLGLGGMAIVNSPAPIGNGGTGGTTAAQARTNLGLGGMATVTSPAPIGNGGTNATTASNAKINLGIRCGRATAISFYDPDSPTNILNMAGVRVDYATAFATVPRVIVTPISLSQQIQSISISNTLTTGFTIRIIFNSSAHVQDTHVNWIAIEG